MEHGWRDQGKRTLVTEWGSCCSCHIDQNAKKYSILNLVLPCRCDTRVVGDISLMISWRFVTKAIYAL